MEVKLKFLVLENGKKVSLEECTPEELVKAISDIANELAKRAVKKK
jgi:hypothetical protein